MRSGRTYRIDSIAVLPFTNGDANTEYLSDGITESLSTASPTCPGLPDLAAVPAVCAAVSKPVNFMAGIKGKVRFPRTVRDDAGAEQTHADLTALVD